MATLPEQSRQDNSDIPIAEIECGRERAKVTLTTYRGHRLFSVWRWFPDDGGELRPGKRGVTIPIAKLPELAAAVNAAVERARDAGFLPNGGGAQ